MLACGGCFCGLGLTGACRQEHLAIAAAVTVAVAVAPGALFPEQGRAIQGAR